MDNRDKEKYSVIVFSGVFLFVVLYLYRSFGIQTEESFSGHSLFFRSVCFGLLASFSFAFNELLLKKFINVEAKVNKFLWRLWEVVFTAHLIYLLFNIFWNWTELNLESYFLMLFEFAVVMVVPLTFVHFLFQNDSKDLIVDLINIKGDNGKTQLKVKPENILYFKAEDNYVDIFYRSGGQVKSKLIRNSLKNFEEELASILIRCHRSFLVNLDQVEHVETKAGKVFLLFDTNHQVPVSKKYQDNIVKL
ncbi:LytTR family DNA-binding domain-containing protein [Marinigracilibium pacificum]|uniref:LytTR family transcriptional regulator n=1 Tax=Marinigracilibium pacificum TaxID=2729599 RepID=A0A848J2P4_9BACT|nr:LytTR family DNA-binding domain-containing protein [Marinigracilibium pacificum]NMM50867.1 LytTR family transcriptional regulator [Marinigracilibium pacificum]